MTAFAGAAFLVSGIFDIISYIRFRKQADFSGWMLAYGILDIIVGALFLIYPVAFAAVIPWVIGFYFVAFGIFETYGAIKLKGAGVKMWGWILVSGIIGLLCGVLFFIMPASFVIFMAVFVVTRGITLIVNGATMQVRALV